MAAVIVDMWSVGRPDMAHIAQACEAAAIWGDADKRRSAFEAGDPDLDGSPTLQLDWDGVGSPHGGPVARVVATGKFRDPRGQILALARAAGLPVIDHKATFGRLELRMSAPLRPDWDIGALALVEIDPRDPSIVLAAKALAPRKPR